MNRITYLILAVASAVVWASAAVGTQPEGRRLALVIGTSGYEALASLDHAVNDAWNIADALRREAKFDVTPVMDATAVVLRQQVADFAAKVGAKDEVVIYYAGHGVQVQGRNYLLPSDFPNDAGQLETRALAADELLGTIAAQRPAFTLLILDACRTSPVRGVAADGLAPMEPKAFGPGTRIEFAASAGQAAQDGLFAKHLAVELTTPGRDVGDVFRSVRARVSEESRGRQTTLSADQLTVNFYFIPAQLPSLGEALATMERIALAMPRGDLGQTVALQALVQEGRSLAGTQLLEGLSFKAGRLSRADLSRALLAGTEFDDTSLQGVNLSGASLSFATLSNADLSDATLEAATFGFAQAQAANFSGAHAGGSAWFATRARGARFNGADLRGAGFMFADLRDAVFDGANLTGTLFVGSDLRGASFGGAVFGNTDLTGSHLDAGTLTAAQRRDACEMDAPVVPPGRYGHLLSVVGTEPIPNSRFDGGIEYSRFHQSQHLFMLPSNDLGECRPRKVRESGWFPIWQQRGQDHLQTDIHFRLSHKLLEQTGRRSEVEARIADHLEWLYPFPAGAYWTNVSAEDVPSEHRSLAGAWSLDFRPDGTLRLDSIGRSPVDLRYEKEPRYSMVISGESGLLQCGRGAAEYRWFLTPQMHLRLVASPHDACVARGLLLQKSEWAPDTRP
jgi:uncharacterized protein YjbI with pentapeptide repeats